MKTYIGPNQLRLVGKVWEIRAALRNLTQHPITLQEFLGRIEQAGRR